MFKRTSSFMIIVIASSFVILVACIMLIIYAHSSTIPSGISILRWDASGIEIGQFRQKLIERIEEVGQQEIVLEVDDENDHDGTLTTTKSVTLSQLGVVFNVDKIIDEVDGLQGGSVFERASKRMKLRGAKFWPDIHIEAEKLHTLLAEQWPELQLAQPLDAKREIMRDDRVTYTPGKSVRKIDTSALQGRILTLVRTEFGQFQPHTVPHLAVDVPTYIVHPEVTVESLVQQGIDRKIMAFTTFYRSSGEGRVHNIQATSTTVHDKLMKPGEVFDFNEIVRETEKKFGYRQAPVIVNGHLVPGVGGGICQVSTTLYNAVLRIGLEIVERRNHSLPIRYVPLGQDATFSSGHINFKFRNNLDSFLLIRVEATNTQITVKLFGSMPDGIQYDIHSKIVEVIDPPITYVHNPRLPIGHTQQISKGKTGYIVDTFRTTKQDGKVIKIERISRDHYKAKPSVVAANPKSIPKQKPGQRPAPKPHIVEDGVSGPAY